MAVGSTVVGFEIALSDVDRGVYEALSLKVAQHPSETNEYLVARVLAYALEYAEGIQFAPGMATSEEPALQIRDLTGQLQTWIEVGTPDAARLHKATKAADRVAVYCHKDPGPWQRGLIGQKVHAPDRLAMYALDRAAVVQLAGRLDRRNDWSLSRVDSVLYVEAGPSSIAVPLEPLPWPTA